MSSIRMLRLLAAALSAAALLSACGGGGGGGGPSVRQPLPTLSQDILPTGARIDRRADNYFPSAVGDRWVYDRTIDNVPAGEVTRSVVQTVGNEALISESGPTGSGQVTYRRTADGLVLVRPLADVGLPALDQVLPTLLEYPEPFYAVGTTRQLIRQGSFGDLDGDGTAESFRIEYRQTLIGFETVTLASGPIANAVHFRNVVTLNLQPSDPDEPVVTAVATEDTWFAPGIGLVQTTVSGADGNGNVVERPYTLRLRAGTVGGEPLFVPQPDGTVTKIALTHQALVYDAPRRRYLASVPGSVPNVGNRIAIVDATTGAVSYSGPVGSEPGALALAPDGSALLVGLNGTGELLKLRLPDFAEQWRVTLPSGFFGATRAETIAVSPLDPEVVAVSLYRASVSPRHDGVVLVRAGVVQPRRTQDHTGSNLVVFDADGSRLYGYNNESTEFGLRRIAVLADGLQEEAVVPNAASDGFAIRSLDRVGAAGGRVLLGRSLYATPALALAGEVGAGTSACRWHAEAAGIVCLGTAGNGDRTVVAADPASLVLTAAPVFARAAGNPPEIGQIVPGGRGLVALRVGPVSVFQPATAVWLFASPQLP